MAFNMFVFAITAFCLTQSVAITSGHPFLRVALLFADGVADVLAASLERLQRIVDGVDTQLTHINSAANHTSCFLLEQQQHHISSLVTHVENQILACITDEIRDVEVAVADILRQATDAVDAVQAAFSSVTECLEPPLSVWTVTCVGEAMTAAEVAIAEATVALRSDAQKAEETLTSAPANMAECATGALQEAKRDGQLIVLEVAQCIIDNSEWSVPESTIERPYTEEHTLETIAVYNENSNEVPDNL